MAKNYKVKANESLLKIAKDNGFLSIDPILDTNADKWPYLSLHPNVLMEGMTILLPDKKSKKVDQSTGTQAVYTVKKAAKQFFTLKIEDQLGEIVSVKDDVKLFINGGSVPIVDKTNYDLKPVTIKVISTANPLPDGQIASAYLKIKFTSVLNGKVNEQQIDLEIGGIDPFLDPNANGYSGAASSSVSIKKAAQKLLMNLGCYAGDLDGDLDKADSVMALIRFQQKYLQMDERDDEYGKPGPKTCIGLGVQQGVVLGPAQPIKYG